MVEKLNINNLNKTKMKKLAIFTLLIAAISVNTSCTKNQRVKNWGGSATMELPANQKLVTVTWKGEQLWYLTRKMDSTDVAETYEFHEESNYGVMEGTYIIKEIKK